MNQLEEMCPVRSCVKNDFSLQKITQLNFYQREREAAWLNRVLAREVVKRGVLWRRE